MPPSRKDRASRTREYILETAASAFARHGYAGTSLNDLVRASGLAKGAFYHHFASKEELARAAFRRKQEQLVERLAAEAGEGDALAVLARVLAARAALIRAEPAFRAVLRLGAELGAVAEPGSEFARFQELPIEWLADLVRRGQAEGAVRADLDARQTAEAIFAGIVGMDDVSQMLSGGDDLERRSEQVVDLLVRGLAADTHSRRAVPA